MGSARRFRKQVPLRDAADAAEKALEEVRDALYRSKLVTPSRLDDHYEHASSLASTLRDLSRALDPMRRAAWKRPGLPWIEIAKMQDEERGQPPSKREALLRRIGAAAAEATAAVAKHHFDHVHGANFEKLKAGIDHHDAEEREVWADIADRTPFNTWSLIRRLRKPPGQRGRPKGSGSYREADEQVLPELNKLIAAGVSPLKAAHMLVDKLPGGGAPESKARRIRRRPEK